MRKVQRPLQDSSTFFMVLKLIHNFSMTCYALLHYFNSVFASSFNWWSALLPRTGHRQELTQQQVLMLHVN
jgi:hypothetical protein